MSVQVADQPTPATLDVKDTVTYNAHGDPVNEPFCLPFLLKCWQSANTDEVNLADMLKGYKELNRCVK